VLCALMGIGTRANTCRRITAWRIFYLRGI
jgi:hypothetical protein